MLGIFKRGVNKKANFFRRKFSCFPKSLRFCKKGDLSISEIVTILIVIVVFVLAIVFVFVIREKGFEGGLGVIKNLLRFGRA